MEHRNELGKNLASYHVDNYFIYNNEYSCALDIKNTCMYSPTDLKSTSDKAKSMY